MACHHPIPAWRNSPTGPIQLGQRIHPWYINQAVRLDLPCSKCLGCRKAAAQGWTLRAQLEMQDHETATFATLTYDKKHLPPTLQKRDLQLFLKRLRVNAARSATASTIRFLACGEYGTQRNRPHYHAILFGLHAQKHRELIEHSWGQGLTQTSTATGRRLAYTAGYVAKKYSDPQHLPHERIDHNTGEIYTYQPPFLQMSRGGRHGHGIGGTAREKYRQSWRAYGILNGRKIPLPRYLHEAWKQNATEDQIQQLLSDRATFALKRDNSERRRLAAEKIQLRQNELNAQTRHTA